MAELSDFQLKKLKDEHTAYRRRLRSVDEELSIHREQIALMEEVLKHVLRLQQFDLSDEAAHTALADLADEARMVGIDL
jgi:hypothetical protein